MRWRARRPRRSGGSAPRPRTGHRPRRVLNPLNLTGEVALESSTPGLGIDGPEDLSDILAHLDVAGEPLAPLQLMGLARFASSVSAVVDRVRAGKATRIADLVSGARSFIAESDAVRRAIEPTGDVADHASQALADIRDGLRKQRARLRSTLEGLTRGRETAKYLQDQIITDRNGRYVVVVRAEHREGIPGIVHRHVDERREPVLNRSRPSDWNNDIVALTEREKAEIYRFCSPDRRLRAREADLAASLAAAAELDELHAKARLAQRMDGIAPEITNEGHLEFRGARHPLLIPAVRDLLGTTGPAVVTPSDLLVSPPAKALIISGPNTGGKTVALKAFGLLALIAQSGLLIPVVAGSRLTPFRTVFADIGYEQSISASLSTFSAHIANIVAMDRSLQLPALILLDEVGSGTDPVEGGALGRIEHFRQRGAVIVATTHDDALKSYGATTNGVIVAAFGFNADTFAPTYQMRVARRAAASRWRSRAARHAGCRHRRRGDAPFGTRIAARGAPRARRSRTVVRRRTQNRDARNVTR
jgi:DNA mismatch repair protein MutS2